MNLILTWASGEGFCNSDGFKVYLSSLRKINCDKVIVTHDMTTETELFLKEEGFKIYRVNPDEVGYPIADRHLHFWRYLCQNPEYDRVLHTDCRDVVIQSNPFEWNIEEPFVLLTDEGMPPSASGFHLIEQFEFQKDVPKLFQRDSRTQPILNGGIVFGTTEAVKHHFFLVWALSMKMSPNVTDQATLNYLYNFLKDDKTYRVSNPIKENFCLTGEGTKDSFVKSEFKDGVFYHKTLNQPYTLVHQWDRTKFEKEVLEHYLK